MTNGGFRASDYNWSDVLQAAAHLLMDDRGKSFTKEEVAAAISSSNIPQGDTKRAGNGDRGAGALVLATEATKALKASSLAREVDGSWRWCGNERTSFTSHGRKVTLRTREEREELAEEARREVPFIGWHFDGLPKREFDPDSDDGRALLASFANGWDDNLPPILMFGDEIIDGRMRKAACERLGIDWRRYTRQASFGEKLTEPKLNMEHVRLALRSNIAIPLSTATKKEIAKRMKLQGYSSAEIATAFNVSVRTGRRLVSGGAEDTVSPAPPDVAKVNDEKLLSLLVEHVREEPKIGKRKAGVLLRDKDGIQVADERVAKLLPHARSLVESGGAPPAPEPEPQVEKPACKHHWVCSVCGKVHP